MVHYRGGAPPSTRRSIRTSTRSGRTSPRPTRGGARASATLGCTYLQLDDTSLAYLNDPTSARARRRDRRRPRPPARDLHPPHQRGARRPAAGHGGHDAHLPRQLPLLVGRRGRLRLRRRGALQRARGRRLLPRVRRRALGRLRAAALRAAREAGRARARHDQARRAREQGRAQAAHRGGGAGTCRHRPALPLAAVRVLLDGRGQRPHERAAGREAPARRRGGREVWGSDPRAAARRARRPAARGRQRARAARAPRAR